MYGDFHEQDHENTTQLSLIQFSNCRHVGRFINGAMNVLGLLYIHPDGETGTWFCKNISSENVKYMCGATSALTLVAVAYGRFQAVVHPLTVKEKVTKKKTLVLITLCWIIPLCFGFPMFLWVKYDEKKKQSGTKAQYEDFHKIIGTSVTLALFLFPTAVMVMFYSRVIFALGVKHDCGIEREQFAAHRVRKRITFMLSTVTIVFALTWGTLLVLMLTSSSNLSSLSIKIEHTVVLFNSSVNAFLYALFSYQYKRGFKIIFLKCERVREVDSKKNHNGKVCEQRRTKTKHSVETKL